MATPPQYPPPHANHMQADADNEEDGDSSQSSLFGWGLAEDDALNHFDPESSSTGSDESSIDSGADMFAALEHEAQVNGQQFFSVHDDSSFSSTDTVPDSLTGASTSVSVSDVGEKGDSGPLSSDDSSNTDSDNPDGPQKARGVKRRLPDDYGDNSEEKRIRTTMTDCVDVKLKHIVSLERLVERLINQVEEYKQTVNSLQHRLHTIGERLDQIDNDQLPKGVGGRLLDISMNTPNNSLPYTRSRRRCIDGPEHSKLTEALLSPREDGLSVVTCATKGRCVVADKAFAKGDFVVEYRGDLIDRKTARHREKAYGQDVGSFTFHFDFKGRKYCIDATKETRDLGRLVNHSKKSPNLFPKVIDFNGDPRLVLFAKRSICSGEELTYDYGDHSAAAVSAYPWLISS